MTQTARMPPAFRAGSTRVRPDAALMNALVLPSLTDRWARAVHGRTEILFSTSRGRFCLHADPSEDGEDAWSFGVLYAFDGGRGHAAPDWQVIKGLPAMRMFDDNVWIGSPAELGADAAAASLDHTFILLPTQRPQPPRSHAPCLNLP